MSLSPAQQSRQFAIAAACIAINLVAGKVANLLSLPVYLDSIGTVTAAAVLHPVVAILVAVGSAVLGWAVISPVYIFYIGTQITIALVAIAVVRVLGFDCLWKALVLGIVTAVAATIVSAPVTVMVFGGVTVPATTAINALLIASGQNIWKAVAAGGLLVDIGDKLAVAVVAWAIVRRLPLRLRQTGHISQ